MVWWHYVAVFFAGVLVCYLLLIVFIRKMVKKDTSGRGKDGKQPKDWYLNPFYPVFVLKAQLDKANERADKLEGLLKDKNRKIDEISKSLKICQNRFDNLDKQNSLLIRQIRNSSPASDHLRDSKSPSPGKEHNRGSHNSGTPSLFFSIPEADGSFYGEKGEPVQDERKYFRITPLAGTDRGGLHFISGRYDQKAIENIDYYLLPVCEVENSSQREKASRVVQVEPGSVIFKAGKWKVDKKVMVKLV